MKMVYITEKDIENIKQTSKTQRLRILPHLYLNVSKNTVPLKKMWYFRGTIHGDSQNVLIGEFNPSRRGRGPEGHVSFKAAKEILAGKMLEIEEKKIIKRKSKVENNPVFSEMCEGWFIDYANVMRPTTSNNARKIIRKYIQTCSFYNKRMKDITRLDIRDLVKSCPKCSAKKLLGFIKQIFQYSDDNGFYVPDPHTTATAVVPTIKGINHTYTPTNFKAIINPTEFGKLICEVKLYLDRNFITSRAILFLAYNFCRSKEMLNIQWNDVDLDFDNLITLDASKTKQNQIFKIPFSRQTKALLLEVKDYRLEHEGDLTNWGDAYVFHKLNNPYEPMSSTAMHSFMHKLGYTKDTHCLHSFRSSASTMLREQLNYRSEVVEAQLGHAYGTEVERIYNRAQLLEQRRTMLQDYADYIDSLVAQLDVPDVQKYDYEISDIDSFTVRQINRITGEETIKKID